MLVAAIFLIRPVDFKRMLAYSSVEHMGIMAVGVGIGGLGTFGALFHAVNHSLAKGMLFLLTGNILAAYGTKSVDQVKGLVQKLPVTGFLWIVGFLAITGTPPFGTFLSEFTILRAAIQQGRIALAVLYLTFLGAAFAGMAGVFLRMAQGTPDSPGAVREDRTAIGAPALLAIAVLLLGLYLPHGFRSVIDTAVQLLEVSS